MFFVGAELFLVNHVCARDLCLLNSVKNDSSLISYSASWQVNNFFEFFTSMQSQFSFFQKKITYGVTVSKVFRII